MKKIELNQPLDLAMIFNCDLNLLKKSISNSYEKNGIKCINPLSFKEQFTEAYSFKTVIYYFIIFISLKIKN